MKHVALTIVALLTISSNAMANRVTVSLKDGTKYIGELDRRTDQRQIWLRYQRGMTTLLRPIAWKRIARVQSNFGELGKYQVAQLAKRPRTTRAGQQRHPTKSNAFELAGQARRALGFSPHIKQVHLRATTTDRETGKSGSLLVCLKATGCVLKDKPKGVKVRSVLVATWTHSRRPLEKTWIRSIDLTEFQSSRGALVHLPFGSARPDRGSEIQLKLLVPGQGRFV